MKKILGKKMIKNIIELKKKIAHNLSFFFIRNLGSRIKHYKYLNFNAGWLLGKINNAYLSIHLRPKNSENVTYQFSNIDDNLSVGLIIQGPISVNNDKGEFLYETIKIYKKIFPKTLIILSTWKLDENIFQKFNKLNIKIIQNDEPKNNRFGLARNIDRQILTTHSGLEYLSEKNITYALKTRTDWRIYKPYSHHFLKNMLDMFPSKSSLMKGRIIMLSMMTCKFRIYGISDTLHFGFVEDLLKLWDKELFLDGIDRLSLGKYPSIINGTPIISDVFLCARYLDKINHKLHWNLEDWWTCLANYFCVVDTDSLDLLWTKYEDWFYEKRYYRSYDNNSPRMIEFSDWVNLYNNKSNAILQWKKLGYQEQWKVVDNKLKCESLF